jgi:nucleotide-binding universal stress UspA family protein
MPLVAAIDTTESASPVLEEANRLATDIDETVHALHVLKRNELVEVLDVDIDGIDVTENYAVQEYANGLVESAIPRAANEFKTAIRIGEPGAEIIRYADAIDARYVLIGGRNRSSTGKALFGSVGQTVLLQSPIPVFNVPTDQF